MQYDNVRVFEGRSGHRVAQLRQTRGKMLCGYVEDVLGEIPDPIKFIDGSEVIAAKIKELVRG